VAVAGQIGAQRQTDLTRFATLAEGEDADQIMGARLGEDTEDCRTQAREKRLRRGGEPQAPERLIIDRVAARIVPAGDDSGVTRTQGNERVRHRGSRAWHHQADC
jgi:hypothetical protein